MENLKGNNFELLKRTISKGARYLTPYVLMAGSRFFLLGRFSLKKKRYLRPKHSHHMKAREKLPLTRIGVADLDPIFNYGKSFTDFIY